MVSEARNWLGIAHQMSKSGASYCRKPIPSLCIGIERTNQCELSHNTKQWCHRSSRKILKRFVNKKKNFTFSASQYESKTTSSFPYCNIFGVMVYSRHGCLLVMGHVVAAYWRGSTCIGMTTRLISHTTMVQFLSSCLVDILWQDKLRNRRQPM